MGYKNILFRFGMSAFELSLALLGEKSRVRAQGLIMERINPVMSVKTKYGDIKFFCPGKVPLMRAEYFHSKESENLDWIDTFQENSVLWDVGANVGVFSLYTALRPNLHVVAFEPAGMNYAILLRNIENNQMDNIIPLCVALSDSSEFGLLHMATTNVGKGGNSFGAPVNDKGELYQPAFKQGMISYTMDGIIKDYGLPFPNYLKIDVDGIEDKILKGAKTTLSNSEMRSMSIELNPKRPDYDSLITLINSCGLKLQDTGNTVNHIFYRVKRKEV